MQQVSSDTPHRKRHSKTPVAKLNLVLCFNGDDPLIEDYHTEEPLERPGYDWSTDLECITSEEMAEYIGVPNPDPDLLYTVQVTLWVEWWESWTYYGWEPDARSWLEDVRLISTEPAEAPNQPQPER